MLNLGALVLPNQNRTVTLQRVATAGGSYNDAGEWVPAVAATVNIAATIQPVSGRQLLDMPEGIRNEARWTIWTVNTVALNDRITYQGDAYRVVFVWPRNVEGGFYRAALGLVTP